MFKKINPSVRDSMNIVWTITSKDIADAIKNKTVVSIAIMLCLILLMPKMLPFIFEQPQVVLPIFDMGSSRLVSIISDVSDISVKKLQSENAFQSALCGAVYPQIGLHFPANFDQEVSDEGPLTIQGFVCWSKRRQVSAPLLKLEEMLTVVLNQPVTIETEGNYVYPPENETLFLGITTINSVMMILMMGIFLVPSLLIEEKENKTLQALLLSPAGIGQVVAGKALAGFFYILVTAVVVFAVSWVEIVHWNMVLLFVVGGGLFSVAVGLLLGCLFEKQQDIIGWVSVLLIILISAIFVKMYELDVPAFVKTILQWVPSVGLSEICMAAFTYSYSTARIITNLAVLVVISLVLYAIAIWKIRVSDR